MKYFPYIRFVITSIEISTFFLTCEGTDGVNRFLVVSDYNSAKELYDRLQRTKTQIYKPPEPMNRDAKIQICKDITGSHLFKQSHLLNCNFHNYSGKWLRVRLSTRFGVQEFLFACLVQKGEWTLKYFVSEEYNLSVDSGTRTSIVSRFIFKESKFGNDVELFGLAEIPAKIVSSPAHCADHCVEHVYLQRRESYSEPLRRQDDALCKLNGKEKARICIAVFNSSYYENRINFPANLGRIRGKCEKRTVLFQTERGKEELMERNLSEWMLSCAITNSELGFNYLLSQAYRPNQTFIYLRDNVTGDVFLESLAVNVRLPVKYNRPYSPRNEVFRPIARLSSF